MTEQWTKIGEYQCMGVGYEEYTNQEYTLIRRVWYDGYIEEYEPA
jgi:hypothetical protein